MKTAAIVMVTALCFSSCHAQENKKSYTLKDNKETAINKPKEGWDVHKETDENGNVIRYDSTYTWSYTNMNGDSTAVNVDSLMQNFHSFFGDKFPSIFDPDFNSPFGNDQMFPNDFFRDDFFQNRLEQDLFDPNRMFQRMDSLRNHLFDHQYPGLMQPPQKNKDGGKRI